MIGLPKAPYSVGDTVLKKVIQLEEDTDLRVYINEYKAVSQSLVLINDKITKISDIIKNFEKCSQWCFLFLWCIIEV